MIIFELTLKYITTEVLIISASITIFGWVIYIRRTNKRKFVFTVQELTILLMPVMAWLGFDVVAYFTNPMITPELVAVSRWARLYVIISYFYVLIAKSNREFNWTIFRRSQR